MIEDKLAEGKDECYVFKRDNEFWIALPVETLMEILQNITRTEAKY